MSKKAPTRKAAARAPRAAGTQRKRRAQASPGRSGAQAHAGGATSSSLALETTRQLLELARSQALETTRAELNEKQLVFAETFLATLNKTQAYRAAYPDASYESARSAGPRLFADVRIQSYLEPRLEAALKVLQMSGDEALARVAIIARDEREKTRDRLRAQFKILEVTGKTKSVAGSIDELAAAIRADREEHGEARL